MKKPFLFTDEQVDAIYDLLLIAKEVTETENEKNILDTIIKDIDSQTNYSLPPMKQFAITAPGFEIPDYIYASTEEEAIIEWAKSIVCAEITEVMPGDGSYEN